MALLFKIISVSQGKEEHFPIWASELVKKNDPGQGDLEQEYIFWKCQRTFCEKTRSSDMCKSIRSEDSHSLARFGKKTMK